MIPVDLGMFLAGLLLLLGVLSSKFSARLGVPVLVVFVAIGMLAGSEGLGRIPFEDYALASGVGSAALAVILFDGGLRTTWGSIRLVWRPALALATVGVAVTSALTGIVAILVLDLPLLYGMLLGAIVGSTDAAAVFSVLRSSGLRLPERLGATLEVESGSNDPMAIFLTLGLIAIIARTAQSPGDLVLLFGLQFGIGSLVGAGVGWVASWTVNRIDLETPGLYPPLVLAFGIFSFGLAALLGGSGFLAVFLTGIVLGNRKLVFRRGIWAFHDAAAWLSQILLFVMLGLLSFPSRLAAAAAGGALIAVALIFIARPVAVAGVLLPFGFKAREVALVSWGGLKGAVPITLATFPLLTGLEHSSTIFDVVFFVVLVSALIQGWSLPLVARRLQLGRSAGPNPPLTVEVHALRHLEGDIVDYTVAPQARIARQPLRALALPEGVAVTLVVRGDEVIVPRGWTQLEEDDHVFIALRNDLKPVVDALFDGSVEPAPVQPSLEMRFEARTTVGQVRCLLGMNDGPDRDRTLASLLAPSEGEEEALGPLLVSGDPGAELICLRVASRDGPADETPASSQDTGLFHSRFRKLAKRIGENPTMGSNFRFIVLLLGMVGLVVVLAFLGLRADRRLASLETLQRAPTAPPLQELRGGLRQVASGRTVYVPVYSHIYAEGGREQLLETTLSIRNMDREQPIAITSIRYYDTDGRLLEEYLEHPVALGPLASTDFLVEQRDEAGGAGANFLVDWAAETAVTEPLIEAVMVRVGGNQAFAFRSPGYPISHLEPEGSQN